VTLGVTAATGQRECWELFFGFGYKSSGD
jgi:hypothetical protein